MSLLGIPALEDTTRERIVEYAWQHAKVLLLTATCRSRTKRRERIVEYAWQHAKVLLLTATYRSRTKRRERIVEYAWQHSKVLLLTATYRSRTNLHFDGRLSLFFVGVEGDT
jgi:uncharacterized membrane protein YhhN